MKENTNTILRKRVALSVIRAQNSDGKFNPMEGLKIMNHHYLNLNLNLETPLVINR